MEVKDLASFVGYLTGVGVVIGFAGKWIISELQKKTKETAKLHELALDTSFKGMHHAISDLKRETERLREELYKLEKMVLSGNSKLDLLYEHYQRIEEIIKHITQVKIRSEATLLEEKEIGEGAVRISKKKP